MNSRNLIALMILILSFNFVVETDAQTRRKRPTKRTDRKEVAKKEKEPSNDVNFLEKLNYDIKIGQVGFFNGFSISGKLNAGYKLSDRFTTGLGTKLFYDQFIVRGAPDFKYFDRGIFGFARGKITQEIYLQAEYNHMVYDRDPLNVSVNYPGFGAGYMSGFGKWKFGLELMYIASDLARDFQGSVVEYWVGASYNF